MPLLDINPKYIDVWDKELKSDLSKIEFWRTAARSEFGDVFFEALNGSVTKDKWFVKNGELESDISYNRRAKSVIDPACSAIVLSTYLGYYSKIKFSKFDSKLDRDLDERIQKDIDLKNTSIKSFNIKILEELLSVGKTYVAVDAMNIYKKDSNGQIMIDDSEEAILDKVVPYAFLIKRENVMDYQKKDCGSFDWIKYRRWVTKGYGLDKKEIEQIIIVDDLYWYVSEKESGNWRIVKQIPNNLGIVPIVDIKMGKNALPIINTIAKWQLDIMNFQSEVRNTLSIQSLNHIQMSKSMAKAFKRATAKTIIAYDDGSPDRARWISPSSNTLQPHFRYLEYAFLNMSNAGNLKRVQKKQVESEGAKEIDWFDSEAVINFASDAIEGGNISMIKIFNRFNDPGKDIEPEVEYDRDYIKDTLEEMLNSALKADLLQIGQTAMIKLTQKVRDRLDLNLTQSEKRKSDKEIMELIEEAMENKQKLKDSIPTEPHIEEDVSTKESEEEE